MQKTTYSKLIITIIITSLLITPALSVSAKEFKKNDNITEYRISRNVIRFEEKIMLDLPDDYGMELPDGAYYTVNVYGVDIGRGVILIDCGDESLAKDLYKSVRKAFKKPVVTVYLTHGHADHAGAGSYFQRRRVPIYASMYEADLIETGAYNPYSETPDQFLYTGYTPDFLYESDPLWWGFDYTYTPGHTMGSVSVSYDYWQDSYLFTGDVLFEEPSTDPLDFSFTLSWYTAYGLWEMGQIPGFPDFIGTWQATLTGMYGLASGYDTVCMGHGAEYSSAYAPMYIGTTEYIIGALPYTPA